MTVRAQKHVQCLPSTQSTCQILLRPQMPHARPSPANLHPLPCSLTPTPPTSRAVTLGPNLVLHLLVAPSWRVSTLHLLTSQHVVVAKTQAGAEGGDGAQLFQNLASLWRQLKDEVALRLLASLHFAANLPAPTGLLTLPMELKEAVLLRLPVRPPFTTSRMKPAGTDGVGARSIHRVAGNPCTSIRFLDVCPLFAHIAMVRASI